MFWMRENANVTGLSNLNVRPWTWLDLAILVFFLALALLLVFSGDEKLDALLGFATPKEEAPFSFTPVILRPLFWAWRILAVMGLGLAIVTFRKPSDFLRHGLRGPGIVATAVCAVLTLAQVLNEFLFLRRHPAAMGARFSQVLYVIPDYLEVAIPAAWVGLALVGRWQAQPDWRDRLGRVLGWSWIAAWAWRTVVHTQVIVS